MEAVMYTRADDDLKKYSDRFFIVRTDDRMVEIRTKFRIPDTPINWCTVYTYSDTHLAILAPNLKARMLCDAHPGTFQVHQRATDGTVLVFEETRFLDLADALKLRRRRKPLTLTPEQYDRMIEGRTRGLRRIAEAKMPPVKTHSQPQESTISP